MVYTGNKTTKQKPRPTMQVLHAKKRIVASKKLNTSNTIRINKFDARAKVVAKILCMWGGVACVYVLADLSSFTYNFCGTGSHHKVPFIAK